MRILDVTLRDGGFVNDFALSLDGAKEVISLLDQAGIEIIEVGYLSGLPENHGNFANAGVCLAWPADLLAEITATASATIAGMLHTEGPRAVDYGALRESGIGLVRLPALPGASLPGSSGWRSAAKELQRVGIPFSVNCICSSWYRPEAILALGKESEQAGAEIFYLADTNGSHLPAQVETIFTMLRRELRIALGYHAHDFKRLALANVFAAERQGAEYIDGSIAGLGRSLGNAALEVLQEISHAEMRHRGIILSTIPRVLSLFGVRRDEEAWVKLTAFLDLIPPNIELLEEKATLLGIDRYQLAVLLLDCSFERPLSNKQLLAEIETAVPAAAVRQMPENTDAAGAGDNQRVTGNTSR